MYRLFLFFFFIFLTDLKLFKSLFYYLSIHPPRLCPSGLLSSPSKIPSVTRSLQSSSSTSRTETAWICRLWHGDHPPPRLSPICWSGCRMWSITTDCSILSPRFYLESCLCTVHDDSFGSSTYVVHVSEEEGSAADAQSRWSLAFRVCSKKMEVPGVLQCRGQDHRWPCLVWCKLYCSVALLSNT